MKNATGVMGGFYTVSEWIMQFSLVNLQWFLFNLPITLLLLNLLYVERVADAVVLLVPILLLLPFIFFPATAAVFAKAREWVRKEEIEGATRSFWSYYKENYKKSMIGGIVFTILWAVLIGDIYYFSAANTVMMNIMFVLAFLLFVFTIHFLSVLVHYDMQWKAVFKQAFLLTLGSPVLFIATVVSVGLILYISTYVFPLIIPFFTCSLVAFLAFSAFYRLHLKLTSTTEG
ncbi:YesL family protein [Pontibacillus salicampi]|uniref:YesL family protein n=1 Tax=Pontibacillus salicampi TaxID=1449801 RepID=A0ABV6LQZ2_9BACI